VLPRRLRAKAIEQSHIRNFLAKDVSRGRAAPGDAAGARTRIIESEPEIPRAFASDLRVVRSSISIAKSG
jgi:hypothetical protein